MSLFFESLWFWFGLAFGAGCAGYLLYQYKPALKTLCIGTALPILVLTVGLSLYYGIDTDRKSIRRMLDGLAATIVSNDSEKVLENYVSPKADRTRALARANMALVQITSVKYRDLKFKVNPLTFPPTAKVQFTGVFYWMSKGNIGGFSMDKPVPEIIKFDIEIEKTNDNSWRITNNCDFTPKVTP